MLLIGTYSIEDVSAVSVYISYLNTIHIWYHGENEVLDGD